MPIPEIYRKSGDILVNYDFVDILNDVGYVTFYGISDEADAKKLTRTALESSDIQTTAIGSPATTEANFDYTFVLAQKVKGDLFVSITLEVDGSASTAGTGRVKVRIIHYDGSTETTIGTQQTSSDLTNPADTAKDQARYTFTFDVDKNFKKGDILRVEVIIEIDTGHVNNFVSFYHDGANRDFTLTDQHGVTARSNLIVDVPFTLEV